MPAKNGVTDLKKIRHRFAKTPINGISPIDAEFSSKIVHRMGKVYNMSLMPKLPAPVEKSSKIK